MDAYRNGKGTKEAQIQVKKFASRKPLIVELHVPLIRYTIYRNDWSSLMARYASLGNGKFYYSFLSFESKICLVDFFISLVQGFHKRDKKNIQIGMSIFAAQPLNKSSGDQVNSAYINTVKRLMSRWLQEDTTVNEANVEQNCTKKDSEASCLLWSLFKNLKYSTLDQRL